MVSSTVSNSTRRVTFWRRCGRRVCVTPRWSFLLDDATAAPYVTGLWRRGRRRQGKKHSSVSDDDDDDEDGGARPAVREGVLSAALVLAPRASEPR